MWFWLRISHEAVLKMSAKGQPSENLTGAGGFSFFLSVCLSIFLSFLLSFFFKAFDSYCHTALWRVLRFYIPTISDTCFLSLFGLPIVFFLFVYWSIVDVCIYLQSIFFVLVLRVQHNDSICVCVYTYILFQIIFPYRL